MALSYTEASLVSIRPGPDRYRHTKFQWRLEQVRLSYSQINCHGKTRDFVAPPRPRPLARSQNINCAATSKCCEYSGLGLRLVGETQPELDVLTQKTSISIATRGRNVEKIFFLLKCVLGRMLHHPWNVEADSWKYDWDIAIWKLGQNGWFWRPLEAEPLTVCKGFSWVLFLMQSWLAWANLVLIGSNPKELRDFQNV